MVFFWPCDIRDGRKRLRLAALEPMCSETANKKGEVQGDGEAASVATLSSGKLGGFLKRRQHAGFRASQGVVLGMWNNCGPVMQLPHV